MWLPTLFSPSLESFTSPQWNNGTRLPRFCIFQLLYYKSYVPEFAFIFIIVAWIMQSITVNINSHFCQYSLFNHCYNTLQTFQINRHSNCKDNVTYHIMDYTAQMCDLPNVDTGIVLLILMWRKCKYSMCMKKQPKKSQFQWALLNTRMWRVLLTDGNVHVDALQFNVHK